MTFESIDPQKDNNYKPEILNIGGVDMEVYDMGPENPKGLPVVFQPGWGGTPEMHRKNLETIASLDRRTLAVNAPHGIETKTNSEEVPETLMRRITGMIEMLDEKKIEKVDGVGYSQGGMEIVLAAKMYPERFRNIVLIDPGGMIGKDNPWRLAGVFAFNTGRQIVDAFRKGRKSEMFKAMTETTKAAMKQPIESAKEINTNSATQIHDTLRELKEKHNIGISIIHGVDDDVFPMDRVQEMAKQDMLDGFYSVKGTHGQIYLEPEKYTRLAEEALSSLEKKEK